MNPEKRVNVVSLLENKMLRTTKSFAAKLVADGTHRYSTKAKLKSFLNQSLRLQRNERAAQRVGDGTTIRQWTAKERGGKEYSFIHVPFKTRKYSFLNNGDGITNSRVIMKQNYNSKVIITDFPSKRVYPRTTQLNTP